MKKRLQNNVFIIIICGIVFTSIGVYAAGYLANDIIYQPEDSSWEVNNVKEAIDSLYHNQKSEIKGKKLHLIYGLYSSRYSIPTFGVETLKITAVLQNTHNGTSSTLDIYGDHGFEDSTDRVKLYSNSSITTTSINFDLNVADYEYLYIECGFAPVGLTIEY